MGLLEWLRGRPRADVRILELGPSSGGLFSASIQNVGLRPCRCGITATVGDGQVDCTPSIVDLGVNEPPQRIAIRIPRALGDRVEELVMRVNDGKRTTERTWIRASAAEARTE